MPRSFEPYQKKHFSPSFYQLYQPLVKILPETPILESRGDRPLQMTFEDQLKALIFFNLEEHNSGRHFIQALKEDDFACDLKSAIDNFGSKIWCTSAPNSYRGN